MEEDSRTTIGLSVENKSNIEDLMDSDLFGEKQDIAKIAMALAIKEGRGFKPIEGAGTVWNVGTFDETGEIRILLKSLYPAFDGSYYKLLESLINQGLKILKEKNQNTDYDFELAQEIL